MINIIGYKKFRLLNLLFIFTDLLALSASALICLAFFPLYFQLPSGKILLVSIILPAAICIPVFFWVKKLYTYHGIVSLDEFKSIVRNAFLVFFSIAVGGHLLDVQIMVLLFLSCFAALSVLFILILRFGLKHYLSQKGIGEVPVAIVGSAAQVEKFAAHLIHSPRLFMRPAYFLLQQDEALAQESDIPHAIFSIENCQTVKSLGIDTLIYLSKAIQPEVENTQVNQAGSIFREIYIVNVDSRLGALSTQAANLAGYSSVVVRFLSFKKGQKVIKRAFDIVISALFILLFWPVYLIVTILVAVDSGLPIVFLQERYGKDGKIFKVHKFRSMKLGSPEMLDELLSSIPGARENYNRYRKLPNDPRITAIGKTLRRFSLDELPQIVNVLKGEMSLIGPRPYTLDELDSDNILDMEILKVAPGITGWWQVMGRNNTTFNERKSLDLYYVRNWSLWMDAYILFKSLWVVFSGTGK